MSFTGCIFPNDKEAFRRIVLAPSNEEPVVEMTDATARDIQVIKDSIQAATAKWRGTAPIHFPNMPMDRKEFWGAFARNHRPSPQPVVEEFVRTAVGEGKLAMDLGCGNSPNIPVLLRKGWRVIAIDSSRAALNILAANNRDAVVSGRLTVIEADITTFTPTEPADLVIATDVFSFINPAQFYATWTKIHDTFVKENGFLVGNLFRLINTLPMVTIMREMGIWFLPDERMVRPLLTEVGYHIKTYTYRIDDPNQEPACVQFVAEKKTSSAP